MESLLQYTFETWGEQQMRIYARKIFDTFDRVTAFPGIGKRRDELAPGLRSHPAEHHVIIYRATDHVLIVERIIHGRRDVATEFDT